MSPIFLSTKIIHTFNTCQKFTQIFSKKLMRTQFTRVCRGRLQNNFNLHSLSWTIVFGPAWSWVTEIASQLKIVHQLSSVCMKQHSVLELHKAVHATRLEYWKINAKLMRLFISMACNLSLKVFLEISALNSSNSWDKFLFSLTHFPSNDVAIEYSKIRNNAKSLYTFQAHNQPGIKK